MKKKKNFKKTPFTVFDKFTIFTNFKPLSCKATLTIIHERWKKKKLSQSQ